MAAAATMVSSAAGLLAMLNESRPSLKLHALFNLNDFADCLSSIVTTIESLYEDEEFQLADLLVSEVFYYLSELNNSLTNLKASNLFDVSEEYDYVHTLLGKAIGDYSALRSKKAELKETLDNVDSSLEAIVGPRLST